MHRIDGGRWPVIPSQLNAQSQQFTILSLVDYFQPFWFPQDLFPASLPTFLNWKYYEGNFLLPATFTSLSQGPAAWEQLLQLNLSAAGYWMEWPELPKIKMLKKCAIRNEFCLLTAVGFKGCWGPLCFRSTPAITRLQQGFGKAMCAGWDGSVRPREHISDSQLNYKIWHDCECSEEIKEQEKTLRCCKSSDFISASEKETGAGLPSPVPGGLLMGARSRLGAAQQSHLQCNTFSFSWC